MYKTILLALVLTGCVSTAYEPADDESAFHKAAVSWVGAPVTDMVVRWGKPNNLEMEARDDRDGVARWRATNHAGATEGNARAGSRYHTCIAEARYGMDGVITKVDTVSSNCEQIYTAEHFALLTR